MAALPGEPHALLLLQSAEAAMQTVGALQTEMLVLMIAVVMHSLVFGKYGVRKVPDSAGRGVKCVSDRHQTSDLPRRTRANIALSGMKKAIGASNLEDTLRILKTVAKTWRAGLDLRPRSGPRFVVRQLVRLAVEQQKVALLLDELAASGLLAGWAAEALLEEASRQGSREAVDAILEHLAADEVQLGSVAHCALFRRARSAGAASRALIDALQQHGGCDSVIAAAMNGALAHGDTRAAALAFAKLPAKPGAELGAAAVKLVAEGLVENQTVLQLFEERLAGVDLLRDARAARSVADAALKAKRADLLKELLATSSSSTCWVSLLREFGAEGRLKDAQEIFKACPERTACLYRALLDLYVDAGEMFAAECVIKSAMKAGLADATTYRTIIKAHLRNGDVQRARCVIETMRSVGLEPSRAMFNELVDAAFRSNPESVWCLVDDMEACGLKPDRVTCSILLKNVQPTTSAGDVARTLAMLNSAAEEMDEVLLSTVCEACIRSGQPDLLRQRLSREVDAVMLSSAYAYSCIIRAFGFVRDLDRVWYFWNDMRKRRILPTRSTLGCMVDALVSNDGPETGYKMIVEMLSSVTTRQLVNAIIYSSVLKGFVHQKQFDRVWEIYSEMWASIDDLQFSTSTYNLLIDACARSCDMARVPGLLNDMSSKQIQPNVITFATIMKGYVEEGDLDMALDLLEDMKKGGRFRPDEITYNTLLKGCARLCHFERGVAVLQDMQEAGVPPSNFTLSLLVKLATRSNRHETAFQLCADISKTYNIQLNVHVYNRLLDACVQIHDSGRAMGFFLEALKEHVRPDARTYALLLRAMMADEDARGVAGLLRAAHGLAGVHPALAGFDSGALQVRAGLPSDVVQEALEGMARLETDRSFTAKLVSELSSLPSARVD